MHENTYIGIRRLQRAIRQQLARLMQLKAPSVALSSPPAIQVLMHILAAQHPAHHAVHTSKPVCLPGCKNALAVSRHRCAFRTWNEQAVKGFSANSLPGSHWLVKHAVFEAMRHAAALHFSKLTWVSSWFMVSANGGIFA